jgi:mannose-6-phosphate isomerase-like protein (cupin superfamily)
VKARLIAWDAARERDTAELCAINELSNHAADPAVSIARARVPRGVTTRWHRLRGIAERYVMLEGCGTVEVEGIAPTAVGPGDVVLIPPGAAQRIRNDGEDDLVFLAVCTPRFVPEAYEDVEETSL